ncbi:autotransporter assembly complex family protein [Mesorhizobium sp. CAU 1741]|uniref:autotransporter assembly complex protein TamA n=1 Tax=Mesorhizobium sp. CAU 1741 TaxID=3140366 RepID=UPI00325B61A8
MSSLVCAAFVAAPLPAHAFELFGIHLFGEREPAEEDLVIGDPQTYEIEFSVQETGDSDIEDTLQSASNLWGERDEPASGAAGLIAKARGDYRRLLATLYSEGRYGGTISILIDGREASDLAPDATLAEPASILVSVQPGPLFTFRQAEIINEAPPAQEANDVVDDPREDGYAPGEIARSGTILRAERLSVEAWRQQGHAKAEIAERRVEAAHDTDVIDARVTVDPGRRATYAPVVVQGTERIDPEWLAWMTGLQPGQEYDPDDLTRAGTRIARLDVFRAARFQEADVIDENGMLPITYIVQEREARRFGVGGTYSTVDGLGLETFWLHRNLFGRAERLRVEAKVAGIGETYKPDEFTYRVGASFVKPGVYTPDTDFSASLFGDREVLDAYTRTAVTATAGYSHLFTEELSGKLFANGGYARFEDDEFGERDFTTLGLSGRLAYDSRDDPADATRGVFLEGSLDPFYEFQYENFAARATAEARAYYGFGEDSPFVLAGRLKLGALVGPPISELPPDMLFFAGGGGSVRGYAYRNIGVPTAAGNVVGGRSLIEASLEARVRVTETIGLVGFVDAGYVGEESIPGFDEDIRIGVGAGLRYLTGLGPIRLDVAMPLDRRSGDPSVAIYVGIGQAF